MRRKPGPAKNRVVFLATGLQVDLEPGVFRSNISVYDSRNLQRGQATHCYDLGTVWRWKGRQRCAEFIAQAVEGAS